MSLPVDLAQSMFAVTNGEGQATFSENMMDKIGRGTLFMKNIEALPQPVHETLIRMHVEPGAKRRMGLDFRLVVSSTQDLRSLSDLGVFPKRLAEVLIANTLRIPPLRRRKGDIPEAAHRRLMDMAKKGGADVKGMSDGFIKALQDHNWPGNDAELSSVLEKVCAFSTRQPMLLREHLPESLGGRMTDKASRNPIGMFPNYREFRENLLAGAERAYLLDVIEFSEGNHTRAEEMTGLSRSRLYELLSKYGLTFKSVSRKNK
jgi:two-component system NtrC family response regulator